MQSSEQEGEVFANHSYGALDDQVCIPPHHPRVVQHHSSHLGTMSTFTSAASSLGQSGSRIAGNPQVPTSSGSFWVYSTPTALPETMVSPDSHSSPFLHIKRSEPPKLTDIADIDVDPVSGRKIINQYEIIGELGRGTHSKVKLGRDLQTKDSYVAIKILERFSKRRKLGKLSPYEDKVKKEVTILKRARHPNIVALLEVIDDSTRKNVYIVLEWMQRGEIQWRVKASKEIALVEARRYEREKRSKYASQADAEQEILLAEAQKRLPLQSQRLRSFPRERCETSNSPEAWNTKPVADDQESDYSEDNKPSHMSMTSAKRHSSRIRFDGNRRAPRLTSLLSSAKLTTSTPEDPTPYLQPTSELRSLFPTVLKTTNNNYTYTDLEDTIYGAYEPSHAERSAPGHESSLARLPRVTPGNLDMELDPELEYVPLMTIQQIRVAFQDTLLGLQYLHSQGIVHRDIKPSNLLVTIDHHVKISDFGVSYLGRPVHEGEAEEDLSEGETQELGYETEELAKTVGTPAFYAPELCITDPTDDPFPVTKAIDVWALGATLFCMLFGRTPFIGNEYVVMRQIAHEEIYIPRKRLQPVDTKANLRSSSHEPTPPSLPSGRWYEREIAYEAIDDELYDLLKRLLAKDPRKRITLEEVRRHQWLAGDSQSMPR